MRGFTLVEMLVVIGMVAILGGIAFVSFRPGNESLALDRASHRIAQDIRRATSLALEAKSINNCTSPDKPASGYGVYVAKSNPTEYIIYGDCDHTSGSSKEGYKSGKDVILETIILEAPTLIDSLTVDGAAEGDWSIAFFPPTPVVAICVDDKCDTKSGQASLVLADKNNTALRKTIKVYASGIVDIE